MKMTNKNLRIQTSTNSKLEIFNKLLVALFIFALISTATAQEKTFAYIENPDSDYTHTRGNDLMIEWRSEQDHASSDTLEKSNVRVQDDSGNYVSENISRNIDVTSDENVSETYTFSSSDLSAFQDSDWRIEVTDYWSSGIKGEAPRIIEAGVYGSVGVDMDKAVIGNNVDLGEGFTVEWSSDNDYNVNQELIETEFLFEDEKGATQSITKNIGKSVSSGSSVANSVTFDKSDFSNIDSGEWNLTLTDVWDEDDVESDWHTFKAASGSISSSIETPTNTLSHNPDKDLKINWSSTNNYDAAQVLQSSEVQIEDGDGNTVSQPFTVEESVSEDSTYDNSRIVYSKELEKLSEGSWTVSITDTWDYGDSTDSVSITGETVEGSVSTTISNPSSSFEHNSSDDLTVDWGSTNNYNTGQELVESEVRVEGDSGIPYTETVSVGETVSSGNTFNHNALSLSSENLSELNPGDWDVTVTDTWELDESSSTVTFTAEDQSQSNDEETESSANYSISVSSPSDGDEFDYGSGEVSVEWESFNDGDLSRNLSETRFVFEGGAGLTQISDLSMDESVGAGSSVNHSVTFDESNWGNLEPGDFTLTVVDVWEDGTEEESSVDIVIDEETQDSGTDDGSTDDSTDGTDDSDSTDDSTDDGSSDDSDSTDDSSSEDTSDGTDDGTDGSDSDSTEDGTDDGSSDDSDSTDEGSDSDTGSNDCPQGYSYNSENEVCVEDSGSEGESSETGSSDSSGSDDGDTGSASPEGSLLEEEIVGPVSVKVLLLILGILGVVALLFWRSDYRLAI